MGNNGWKRRLQSLQTSYFWYEIILLALFSYLLYFFIKPHSKPHAFGFFRQYSHTFLGKISYFGLEMLSLPPYNSPYLFLNIILFLILKSVFHTFLNFLILWVYVFISHSFAKYHWQVWLKSHASNQLTEINKKKVYSHGEYKLQ